MKIQHTNFRAERENLIAAWPDLMQDILGDPSFADIPQAASRLRMILEMNCTTGKQNRAVAFLSFYNALVPGASKKERRLSFILGWIIEISQAAAIIADDLVDGSKTRRGGVCWYQRNDVGASALSDSLLLENLIYYILYKYFSNESYFSNLLALAHDIILKTTLGQSIDTTSSFDFNLNLCTMQKYRNIVKYKTSFYTFYYPCANALIMAGSKDKNNFRRIEKISLEMGFLFQVQDDYLDCYGNPALTGKVGTDISDRKCTWLLVKALELATDKQREIIKNSYANRRQVDEDVIRNIYTDLGIVDQFKRFEEDSYQHIISLIECLPKEIPQEPLLTLLNALYQRKK